MSVRFFLLLTITIFIALNLQARDDTIKVLSKDIIQYHSGSVNFHDSIPMPIISDDLVSDSLSIDTLTNDSLNKAPAKHKSGLEDKVMYSADDSMMISVTGERLYLYGNANVKYTNIELTAEYIMLDLIKEEVFATGVADSSGNVTGSPVFKQGNESFESDSIKYNFRTEKGIIYHIITKQGEGYLHSDLTKRMNDGHIDAQGGKYTTCDAKHPHFYLAMTKAIIIPDDKIITGPAYFVLEDVPLPVLGIPFGFFPNTTSRTSGLLFPTYGAGDNRGFFLRDGGWYQVLGDYADLTFQGDVYSKGSWGISVSTGYRYRYHYSGNFSFHYNLNKNNDDIFSATSKDYRVFWRHSQDPKSNPTQSFSANVNYSSSQYDKKNSYDPTAIVSGVRSSSISYVKNWPGSPFNLSLSTNATQTVQTKLVDVNLPSGSFNMSSIYPFRSKSGSGKYKWWENITLSYSSQFANKIKTYDTIPFSQKIFDNMETGFTHSIPLGVNFKVGKMITIGPSVNYTGMIYTKYIKENVTYNENPARIGDTLNIEYDTVHQVTYIHGINPSISISISPKIYGMFISKKKDSYIIAVRHVLSPSAGFSFIPDMRKINTNYYDSLFYYKSGVKTFYDVYSKYEKEIYRVPTSNGKSGAVRLSLNNNLEMKVRPKNDTTGEPKKVTILDNLNFSTGYSPFKDKFKWDDVAMVAGTKLFNQKLNMNVNSRFSLYAKDDSTGLPINTFYYNDNGKPLRFTSLSLTAGISFQSKAGNKKGGDKQKTLPGEESIDNTMDFVPGSYAGQYVDFSLPWSANINYGWTYSKTGKTPSVQHTVDISGNFNFTPKWSISYLSSYDIEAKKVTMTNFNITRDLHCWQMSFSVVPFGKSRFYSFNIRAKSSLLSDLKYDKKSDYRYDRY